MTQPISDAAWSGPAKVRELMTTKVTSISPDETLAFALELMLWGAVHHLPVVRHDRLVGLVSDRDLLSRKIPWGLSGLHNTPVRDVMATDVQTASPDDDVADAAARMAGFAINCLPVMDGDKLVGILTSTDILAERGRMLFKAGRGEVPSAATVMTTPVVTLEPSADIFEAVALMLQHGIRHLPVVDDGRVLGMVSERDLRAAVGGAALSLHLYGGHAQLGSVSTVMVTNAIVVREDASLFELAGHFVHHHVGAVPVIDQRERLVGIVSYVDLLRYLLGETHARPSVQ